jgi:hypothetical protein
MRNFFHQGPPPMRHNQHFQGYGPGRMSNFGYNQPPPRSGFYPGSGPQGGAKGSSKIESFMDTCNRFLTTAQGFQPYIAQATPLFRNLPALWRLYKGFSSGSKESDYEEAESSEFHLESSSDFEYEYKDDKLDSKYEHSSRDNVQRERKQEGSNKPKHKYEHSEDIRNSRSGTRFTPARNERKREQKEEVVKLAKPLKTKPSRPMIFQPTFDFDE